MSRSITDELDRAERQMAEIKNLRDRYRVLGHMDYEAGLLGTSVLYKRTVERLDNVLDGKTFDGRAVKDREPSLPVEKSLAEAQHKLEKLGEVARKLRKDAAVYNANEHVHLSAVASGAATMIEEALSSLSLEALSELGVGAGVVGVAKEDSGWAVAGERVELRRFSSGFWSSEKFTHPFTDAQVDKHFDVVEAL